MSKKPTERERNAAAASSRATLLLVKALSSPKTLLERLVLTVALAPPRALAGGKTGAATMTRRGVAK